MSTAGTIRIDVFDRATRVLKESAAEVARLHTWLTYARPMPAVGYRQRVGHRGGVRR